MKLIFTSVCLLGSVAFLLSACGSPTVVSQTPRTPYVRNAVDTIIVHDAETTVSEPETLASINREYWKEVQARRRAPRNTFEVSAGYGWITSNLYSADGYKLNDKGGMEVKLAYDRVFGPGLGFGLVYSGFFGNIGGADLKLNYFAPAFVGRNKFGNWNLKYGLGFGFFMYDDEYQHFNRLGYHYEVGIEYMVSPKMGVGISTSSVGATLPEQDGLKDDVSGIVRINVMGGLRFYF